MYFTNSRSIPKHNSSPPNNTNNTNNNIAFGVKLYERRLPNQPKNIVNVHQATVDTSKKILWGPSFWFFFHTLAEKVKPEYFNEYREALFKIIREICHNLPCPSCASHATQYIDKINFNLIRTKEDLSMMLFTFHNDVNKRKNVPMFPYNELQPKYEKAIFINIVNHFMHFYKMEHHVVRLISDNMYRNRSAKSILEWLHANQHIFNK